MGLVQPPIHPLGSLLTTAQSAYDPGGYEWDYAVGGIPFLNAIHAPETAFRVRILERVTAPYTKTQID